MRLLLHDFGGYSFPLQLSRELVKRGHQVAYVHSGGLPGPNRITADSADSQYLEVRSIPLASGFRKYSPIRRLLTHRKYASDLKTFIAAYRPDVVLSGNTPIDIQAELAKSCRRLGIGFVHWVQDVYSLAIDFFLQKKIARAASLLTFPFTKLELSVARRSDHTVVIAPDFRDTYLRWGLPQDEMTVIENWAPLEDMPVASRNNSWSAKNNLDHETVFLYSGTLGLKHRPDLIYQLAKSLGPGARVVVISEGVGRNYLASLPPLQNLTLLDFQPYNLLPEVLASADVLLAMLESDAGSFAVPSKILTYLCAGRPILLAAPSSNLSATVVERSQAGIVVNPDNTAEWLSSANRLANDSAQRQLLSANARAYAERAFDIRAIASNFETILTRAIERAELRSHKNAGNAKALKFSDADQ